MNYQKFTVAHHIDCLVDIDQRASRCNRCGDKIYWGTTERGMNLPLNKIGETFKQHKLCKNISNGRLDNQRFIDEEERNQEELNNL